MDGVQVGGHRRIDRVLSDDFLDGLGQLTLAEVRTLRDDADQEETDLSYLRRLLQARLDLVSSEVTRRAAGEAPPDDLIAHLTAVLTDGTRAPAYGLGRHRTLEPSRAGESRRYVEQLVSDDLLTNLTSLPDEELATASSRLRIEEAAASGRRAAVQRVLDAVSGEITRRYRDGEADVAALLGPAAR